MRIGEKEIGRDHPVYVIAEIGVNHDGDPDRAVMLTDAAADAGADAVKLQFFETDLLMSRASKLAAYQAQAGETDPFAMLRRLELRLNDMARVVERAHERGIHAIVTVFSVELVEQAQTLGWDAYKTASPDLINKPLLEALAGTGKPMIVSTGAADLDEVSRAVGWLDGIRDRLAVLQCVSSYPAPSLALGGIRAIEEATGLPTGYSDHDESAGTGGQAVAAGACLLEKHVTDDRSRPGPDHRASLLLGEMASYIGQARAAVGTRSSQTVCEQRAEKLVLDCERDVRHVSRQSLVAVRDLRAGHQIVGGDLTIKRPGTGVGPFLMDETIGRVLARDVVGDMPLRAEDLKPLV